MKKREEKFKAKKAGDDLEILAQARKAAKEQVIKQKHISS